MRVVSFNDFVTKDLIIRLLAKERGKYAAKKNSAKSDKLYEELSEMMPPRSQWTNAGASRRPRKREGSGPERWTRRRRLATARAYVSIEKIRKKNPDAPWVGKMEEFISEIRDIAGGKKDFVLKSPAVYPQFKEVDKETGDFIFRPICVYEDENPPCPCL